MKKILIMLCLVSACATVGSNTNPYAYEEAPSCPARMDSQQFESGLVRCRALCSSYARDVDRFDKDCKCYCKPARGAPVYKNPMQPQSNQI